MLPNPIIFNRPLNAWLGILLLVLILLQIAIGKGWVNLSFSAWHKKWLPIIIVVVMLWHAWYGLQIYFFR